MHENIYKIKILLIFIIIYIYPVLANKYIIQPK